MSDVREEIIVQLLAVCTTVEGIAAVERNKPDVTGLRRPAILLHDGSEDLLSVPPKERGTRLAKMALTPGLTLMVRTDGATPAGPLMSLYRTRLVKAVLSDPTLAQLTGTNGSVDYHGCTVNPPSPEAKEPRMDVLFTFNYVLRLTDL